MSIFSDHACGAMDDFEFDEACKAMNRQERYYEQQGMYHYAPSAEDYEGCPYDYAEVDEGDECIGCMWYECCKSCFSEGGIK